MEVVTIVSILAILYAYFGYPICLKIFANANQSSQFSKPEVMPRISIIITVRNEAAILEQKLEATLALEYFGKQKQLVQIIVASDASDDGSDEIVKHYATQGVVLIRTQCRGGKEAAQGEAVQFACGELIVFTDAKIELNQDALENVVNYFSDPTVGAVSSLDRVVHADTQGSGEGFYIKYEMWLRRLESKFGSLVGVSGSAFAVRRELCESWRADIPSDFSLLLRAQERGLRGVMAEDFIGSYYTVKTEEEEFSRKVRTVLRGMTTLFRCCEVFEVRRYGWFSWQVISHKLCRWLVPWFILFATFGLLGLIGQGTLFTLLGLCMILGYAAAAAAYFKPELRQNPLFKVPLFFLVANAAIFAAWIYYLSGKRSVQWSPSNKEMAG